MEAQRFTTDEWANLEVYGSGHNSRAKLKNLSRSGAYLEFRDLQLVVEEGDLLRITVHLGALGKSRRLSAEVVWLKKPAAGFSGIGVSFLKPEEVYQKLSSRY